MVQDRDFDKTFYRHGICRVIRHFLPKVGFPPFLAAILNFCVKMQKPIYRGSDARLSDFDKIFDPRGILRVNWHCQESIFLPFLQAV